MTPFAQITSRDDAAFPFDAFSRYPKLLVIDWREEEGSIVSKYCKLAGLAQDEATLVMDDATGWFNLIHKGGSLPIPWSEDVSAQHSTVVALQKAFGQAHAIRYSQAAAGDSGFFIVETPQTWQRLEAENPHVRWFFTPVELLPDTVNASFDDIREAGRRYAEGA